VPPHPGLGNAVFLPEPGQGRERLGGLLKYRNQQVA
jgi:hypothetical protein